MVFKRLKFVIIAGWLILLTSCYSDYIYLNYKAFPGAQWNNHHSQITFIASTSVYKQAKGISAFPDGGTPKYLRNDVNLFILDTSTLILKPIVNFNDLASLMKHRWAADVIFTDSVIYYKIHPNTDWEQYLKWAKSKNDSISINSLKDKYSKVYEYNLYKGNMDISALTVDHFTQLFTSSNNIGLTDLNKIISDIPLKEWGLDLQKIYPQPDKEYIEDLIYTIKGGSWITKRAIVEQIISDKSDKEIMVILDEMDAFKNSLNGLERKEYELYSKDTYDLIKKILEN